MLKYYLSISGERGAPPNRPPPLMISPEKVNLDKIKLRNLINFNFKF